MTGGNVSPMTGDNVTKIPSGMASSKPEEHMSPEEPQTTPGEGGTPTSDQNARNDTRWSDVQRMFDSTNTPGVASEEQPQQGEAANSQAATEPGSTHSTSPHALSLPVRPSLFESNWATDQYRGPSFSEILGTNVKQNQPAPAPPQQPPVLPRTTFDFSAPPPTSMRDT